MKLTLDNQTDVSIEILVNNEIIIVEPFKQTQVETDDKHINIKRKNNKAKHFYIHEFGLFNKYDSFNATYYDYLKTKVCLPTKQKKAHFEICAKPFSDNKYLKLRCFDIKGIDSEYCIYFYSNSKQRNKILGSVFLTLFLRYGLFSIIGFLGIFAFLIDAENLTNSDSIFVAIMAIVFVGFGGFFLYNFIELSKVLRVISKDK